MRTISGLRFKHLGGGERIAQALNMSAARGVLVERVDNGSPAAEAGFQPYDVIVAVEGRPVSNSAQTNARLIDFRPGDEVRVTVVREGEERELSGRRRKLHGVIDVLQDELIRRYKEGQIPVSEAWRDNV
jgi:S1-C subfamily serine protease